jgi:hypothetical protein
VALNTIKQTNKPSSILNSKNYFLNIAPNCTFGLCGSQQGGQLNTKKNEMAEGEEYRIPSHEILQKFSRLPPLGAIFTIS